MAGPRHPRRFLRRRAVSEAPVERLGGPGSNALSDQASSTTAVDTPNNIHVQLGTERANLAAANFQNRILNNRLAESLRYNRNLLALTDNLTHELATRKLRDDDFYLNGAFVERPSPDSRLNQLVLPCLPCARRGQACDNLGICVNCRGEGSTCIRLRCGRQHNTSDGCPDGVLCALRHDTDGWLLAERERPRW